MNGLTKTEEFGVQLTRELSELPHQLMFTFLLTTITITLVTVSLCVLVYLLKSRKQQYLYKTVTPLKLHRIMLGVCVLFAVFQAMHLNSAADILIFIVGLLMLLITFIGMWQFNRWGLFAEICFLCISLPIKEIPLLFTFQNDLASLAGFSPPGQLGVYAAAEYAVTRAIATEIIASFLIILLTGYYARRKYLFAHTKTALFGELTKCPSCKIPLVFNGDFCPCCGNSLIGFPRSIMHSKPAIVDRFCRNCGTLLKKGFCSQCATKEEKLDHFRESITELTGGDPKSIIKSFVCTMIAAAFVLFPILSTNLSSFLLDDTSQISNIFILRFNEIYKDSTLSKDEQWLQVFDPACDDLYNADSRAFNVNTDRLNYNNLYLFIGYTEASYNQMIVLDRIQDAVHSGTFEESRDKLAQYFNYTTEAQQSALTDTLSMSIVLKNNILFSLENIAVDSVRFYISFINRTWLCIGLFVVSLAAFCLSIPLWRKRIIRTDFIHKEIDNQTSYEAITSMYIKERRKEFLISASAVLIVLLLFGAEIVFTKDASPDFSTAFAELYVEQGTNLLILTTDIQNPSTLSESEITEAKQLIAAMRENISIVADANTEDVDNTEDLKNIKIVAENLEKYLNSFETAINNKTMPNSEIIEKMTAEIKSGVLLNREFEIQNTYNAIKSLFED